MSKESLGIGVIGAGLIGLMHSAAIQSLIGRLGLPARLAHVADLELDKARRFQQTFGFARASADPLGLIADPEVDAVFICVWTSAHAELALAAARAGKPVFCEKPLAFTFAEAARMRDAVESRGVINQVGLVLRQGPIWNVAREILSRTDLGLPLGFVFRDDQCFPIKGAHPSTWRQDPARAGHGTVIEHSIHDLDLVEWLFGPVVRIRARTAERFGHREIEDLALIELELASGMSGELVSIWHDVERRHSNRRLEVFHERLFLALESEFTGPITVQEAREEARIITEAEVNQQFWAARGIEDTGLRRLSLEFGALEDYLFLQAAAAGQPSPGPSFGVAARAHELVDAVYASARSGDWVAVDGKEEG